MKLVLKAWVITDTGRVLDRLFWERAHAKREVRGYLKEDQCRLAIYPVTLTMETE